MIRILLTGIIYITALVFVMNAPANRPPEKGPDPFALHRPSFSVSAEDMFSEEYRFDRSSIKEPVIGMAHVDNTRTDQFISYFTRRARSRFQMWLHRSNKYIYFVRDILRREGLPIELAMLPLTESGYGVYGHSHAGAVGMWQFMPYTGREYGLKQTYWVDERRDFEKATYAAVRLLRNMHRYLDDWHLTIAAYNAGYGRITRGMRRYGVSNFFDLQSKNYLANETKNYVPKFIAMTELYQNYERYGFETPDNEPLHYESVRLPFQVSLYAVADALGIGPETMKELNPELRRPLTPPEVGYPIRVPAGMGNTLRDVIMNRGQGALLHFTIHFARTGERLSVISETYHVPAKRIRELNDLPDSVIRKDRPIFIPNACFRSELDMAFLDEMNENPPPTYTMHHPERVEEIYASWVTTEPTLDAHIDSTPFSHPALASLVPVRAALWGNHPDAIKSILYPDIIARTVEATDSLWKVAALIAPISPDVADITEHGNDIRID